MKVATRYNAKGKKVGIFIRHEVKRRPFASWKREVWGIVSGLPVVQAAEAIKRIADDSFNAGELTRRSRDAAHAWAERIFWRTKLGVVE